MKSKKSTRLKLNLTLLSLFLVLTLLFVKQVYANYHYQQLVLIPGAGHAMGGTYKYSNNGDNVYSIGWQAGTQYHIAVQGRVWGPCSRDMLGCTTNWWIVKDEQYHSKWWSAGTDFKYIASHLLNGIGVARHAYVYRPGLPTQVGYTSENGTQGGPGANESCFFNGPAASANIISGLPCP